MITETKNITKTAQRPIYGETLIEMGKNNENIVVLDADVSCSTQTQMFAKVFPERFFNVGISEQDAIGTAVGLSTCGKIPFVSTFAVFASGRAWEQIRNGICYAKFNVKIVATHGGITVGEDGATHQGLEDISLMRSIPNMTVIVPSDAKETKEVLQFASQYNGPVYIRLARGKIANVFDENYEFNINKAQVVKEGKDVTLIANGETFYEALKCSELLEEKGISTEVLNVPVIKPLDNATIIESARKTKAIAIIENHSVIGGLGSAVSECLSENCPTIIKRIGTEDTFGQSGKESELLAEYGLTAETFIDKVIDLVNRK